MTALSDTNFPSHFEYPTNVKEIVSLDYQDSDGLYRVVRWCDPLVFLNRTDGVTENFDSISDKNGGTTLRITNNKQPSFYTSFDDQFIVCDAYETTEDTTLQASKVRSWGTKYPTFTKSDTFTPDLDATVFPYLLAEAKSSAMSLLKGGTDAKVEQAARRHKSFLQDDMFRTKRANKWSNYGR